MNSFNIPLRIVFYREDDRWMAHCLEFDLLGDGDTQQEALESLATAISIQVEYSLEMNNPENLLNPAPQEYWMRYAKGHEVARGQLNVKALPALPAGKYELPFESFREFAQASTSCDLIPT